MFQVDPHLFDGAWRLAKADRVGLLPVPRVSVSGLLVPGLERSLAARQSSTTPGREATDDVGGSMNTEAQQYICGQGRGVALLADQDDPQVEVGDRQA